MFSVDVSNLHCNCLEFTKDLITFIREICDVDQQVQWKKFEYFVKQSLRNVISEEDSIVFTVCSEKLCTIILENQDKFKGIKLSTLLLNVVGFIYLNHSGAYFICIMQSLWWNLDRQMLKRNDETFQTLTALEGKSEYMKLLVNLDLISSLKNGDASQYKVETFISINLDIFLWLLDVSDNGAVRNSIKKLAKEVFFHSNNDRSLKRLYLTTVGLLITQLKKKKGEKEYIYFLRMYFVTTRDPFLTLNESFFEEYTKLMPECSAKLEPRNLTDLVRCQIRENLKKCDLSLPVTLEKLSLPQPLKEFILGDVIEMSRKNGKVSPELLITELQLAEFVSKSVRT